MIYNLKSVKDAQVKDRIVLLRVDMDVPVKNLSIEDDSRLNAWLPTLQYLLDGGASVIVVGHLGRPEGKDEDLTLLPVVKWLSLKLNVHDLEPSMVKIREFDGWKLSDKISVLENIRFYPEEENNDPEFAQKLASLAQTFVNDAFATAHRAHASTEGVTHFLPSFAGLRVLEEVRVLSDILENPKRPLCVIIGGAKIETKLPLVKRMCQFADHVLVGGEIARNSAILSEMNSEKAQNCSLLVAKLNEVQTDITPESLQKFIQVAGECQTIVWNGPMGLIPDPNNPNQSTFHLAKILAESNAYKVVGGGDTVGFLKEHNLLGSFSFVSTGGGAMLEFLSSEKLPGLVALETQ
jgi:phosphoglycerate kinase